MNSGPTSERIYAALKARILGDTYAPGARLDPSLLASELAGSVTPVRDVLHLLAGEQLVEVRSGDGFHIPHLTGPELEDLYAVNSELLLLSLRRRAPFGAQEYERFDGEDVDVAERPAVLFAFIARRSTNAEHARLIKRINDRLAAVRTIEPVLLADSAGELAAIEKALGNPAALRKEITGYHRRRRRLAFDLVRTFYRRERAP